MSVLLTRLLRSRNRQHGQRGTQGPHTRRDIQTVLPGHNHGDRTQASLGNDAGGHGGRLSLTRARPNLGGPLCGTRARARHALYCTREMDSGCCARRTQHAARARKRTPASQRMLLRPLFIFPAAFSLFFLRLFRQSKGTDELSAVQETFTAVAKKHRGSNTTTMVKWQYIGSEEGWFSKYPAKQNRDCSSYDPRSRPWYCMRGPRARL